MNCLHCGREYDGDVRSFYCGPRCRKRAENRRARLKRLMADYPRSIRKMDQAASEGDHAKANRAKARAHRVMQQINDLQPVFSKEQRWLSQFYEAIGRFL